MKKHARLMRPNHIKTNQGGPKGSENFGFPAQRSDAQTRESKVVVSGITIDGKPAQAVVKVGFTGKPIVITAYVL